MFCPNCGKDDIDKYSSCPECGGDLRNLTENAEYKCYNCLRKVGENAKYCMWCGDKLEDGSESADVSTKEMTSKKSKFTFLGFISMTFFLFITLCAIGYIHLLGKAHKIGIEALPIVLIVLAVIYFFEWRSRKRKGKD